MKFFATTAKIAAVLSASAVLAACAACPPKAAIAVGEEIQLAQLGGIGEPVPQIPAPKPPPPAPVSGDFLKIDPSMAKPALPAAGGAPIPVPDLSPAPTPNPPAGIVEPQVPVGGAF